MSFLEIKGERVLIFFPGHAAPLQVRGERLKISEKSLLRGGGVRIFYFGRGDYIDWGGGGNFVGRGHVILK